MKSPILISLGLAAATLATQAQITVTESFNYSTGTLGTTATNGTGQTGNWVKSATDSSGASVGTTSGVTWAISSDYGYTPTGNALGASTGTPWTDTGAFQLSSGINFDGPSVTYFSFLARTTDVGSVGLISIDASDGTELARIYQTVGGPSVTASLGGGTTGNIFGTDSQDLVVLGRLTTVASGDDKIELDIVRSNESIAASFTADATASGAVTGTGDFIRFWNFTNGGSIGEFRMGTTYESVAVPEPSTYALLAGFLALGLVMVRRRVRS
jgi:hypothetical protein